MLLCGHGAAYTRCVRPPATDPLTEPASGPVAPDWEITAAAAAETRRLGAALGRLLEPGMVVLLEGELGAGKTVFAQGVAQGLGVPGVVNSPTFVLVNEHTGGRIPFVHADLYRLGTAAEIEELALEETAASAALVVEWPERAMGALPPEHLHVRIAAGAEPDERRLHFHAAGAGPARVLTALRAAWTPGSG